MTMLPAGASRYVPDGVVVIPVFKRISGRDLSIRSRSCVSVLTKTEVLAARAAMLPV
jgi:hypothetical protein